MQYPKLEKWPKNYFGIGALLFREVIGKVVNLDIETIGPEDNGLNPYDPKTEILSIALSVNGKQYGFRLDGEYSLTGLKLVQRIIESPEVMVCGHNIKFDLNFLCYKFKWKMRCLAYDTMLGAYFLNENDIYVSLEELCDRYEVMNQYKTKINRRKLREMHPDDELLYNMRDTKATRLIKDGYLDPALEEHGLTKIMGIGCQAIPVLSKMETRGVLVDQEYAKREQMKLYEHLIDIRQELKELAMSPFNPDSPKQLASILFNKFDFNPVKWTNTGAGSTDSESIIRIRQEQCGTRSERGTVFIEKLLEYNKLVGLNEKYYGKLPKWIQADGCVHTSFNIGVTATGRLSSSNPNMQNQKRGSEFRGVYIPRPGYIFLEGDFSQIELRIAAWLAKEKRMLRMFEEGKDIHTATLCEMTGRDYEDTLKLLDTPTAREYQDVKNLRVGIKNINFGEIYGASPERLQREMVKNGIYWELEECIQLCNDRKKLYPNIVRWKKQVEQFIITHKYVRMPLGQIRRLPNANENWKDQDSKRAIRQGINFIIQSTASGWLPIIGMILLDKYFQQNPEWDGCILLQVHDSILCEVKNNYNRGSMAKLKKDMQRIMEVDIKEYILEVFGVDITVPLEFKCDYLSRWR
jgi:DNA polymerase-1